MTDYPKRLIEVDLPIKKISEHARREKSIRHGHISTLHIWWARRPLAACRAVLCAALWPDPGDSLCPEEFKRKASELMQTFWDPMGVEDRDFNDPLELRRSLLDFIADFANWDNSTKKEYLETSRALTQTAHEAMGGIPGTRPLVVDPFAGGGAIPLEALRVGADAFASDLNPVAVLLNKVVLEYIPKYGQQLADEVRKWGEWVKQEAEKELAEFYPKDPDGATPIAYLWARTITCEGPGCGAEVPLIRSLWLANKGKRSIALQMIPSCEEKRVDFEIIENAKAQDVADGSVRRGSATCPCCGFTTPVGSVKKQLKARRGGAADARLFCVVTTRPGQKGRFYRLPTERDLEAMRRAAEELERRKKEHKGELSLVPDEPYPDETGAGALSSSVSYGLKNWGDVFTPRQALANATIGLIVKDVGDKLHPEIENELGIAIQTCLAQIVDKVIQYNSSLCRWKATGENLVDTFGRQALPMVWDFSEANIFGGSSGDLTGLTNWVLEMLEMTSISTYSKSGNVEIANAIEYPLPDDSAQCFLTDPPYYDAIAYGDLSDFFYVWLRRILINTHPSLFSGILVDKTEEIVQLSKRFRGPYAHKTEKYFEIGMKKAMSEGRRILNPSSIGVVVFAHKSTTGWEAQLKAMFEAGWTITGSWPIDTEMGTRMNAAGTAALASSIHLVCRPRENPDGSLRIDDIGDWRDVLQELPVRIHEWMPRLAEEGIVGADAIFACLGPALEIYSRHSSVEKASGEQVTLKEYLEHVWAAVAKEALNMIFKGADATGFEEDARLTAMWLWTLSTNVNGNGNGKTGTTDGESEVLKSTVSGGFTLEYDAARKIAQGLGAHLEKLTKLVETKGGKARLLPVEERTTYLFGKDEGQTPKGWKKKKGKQLTLSNLLDEIIEEDEDWGDMKAPPAGTTVLDRLHQAMILFAAGRGEALKRFLVEDGVGRDDRFWRLAQALSALYPPNSNEKRWVDGVMARKKGLGF